MQKLFAIVTAFALVMSAAPSQVQAAAGPGDLIKAHEFDTVYYFGEDGQRHPFPNEATYFSWFVDFEDIKIVSADDLATLPIGDTVVVQAGTWLIKLPSNPTVYVVTPGGQLRELTSEAQAIALFGEDWAKRIIDLPEGFFSDYGVGRPLDGDELPSGSLLARDDDKLFRLDDDGLADEINITLIEGDDVFGDFTLDLEDLEDEFEIDIEEFEIEDLDEIELHDLMESLQLVDVDDEDEDDDIDELEVEDIDEDEAQEEIDEAQDDLEDSDDELAELESEGVDIAEREALIVQAEALLAEAQAALAAGDVEGAEDLADQAGDLLDEATRSQNSGSSDDQDDNSEDDESDDAEDADADDDSADADDSDEDDAEDEIEND